MSTSTWSDLLVEDYDTTKIATRTNHKGGLTRRSGLLDDLYGWKRHYYSAVPISKDDVKAALRRRGF